MSFLSGPLSRPPVPVYTTLLFIGSQNRWHKRDYLRFRIIVQYLLKTKFADALKLLVACEKMAN